MWTDVVAWFQSAAGMRLLDGAIVPFVAIVVAGLIAGLVVRAAVRGSVARAQRDSTTAVVVAVAEAARRAATTIDVPGPERDADERLAAEAELRLRLLPLPGAELAADWSALAIAALRASAGRDDPDVEADLDALRSRLVRWLHTPKQARRLFPRPAATRAGPSTTKASKRDGSRRRSTAVDVPAGIRETAALERGGSRPTAPGATVPGPGATTEERMSEPATGAELPGEQSPSLIQLMTDGAAPSTAPVPLARHIAPATANPPTEERLGPEPIVDHRSSRQADDDDDADFMQGSDQQGPPPVAAMPARETAPAGQ